MHPLPPPSPMEFVDNASVEFEANASVEFVAIASMEFVAKTCCVANKTRKAPKGREVAMILLELDFHTEGTRLSRRRTRGLGIIECLFVTLKVD